MHLITAIRDLFRRKAPVEGLRLNRKARRAIAFASTAEKRMRLERTAIRIAKRKAKRGVTGSDNGARTRRIFQAGVQSGMAFMTQKVQQAYLMGLDKGKAMRRPLIRLPWVA